MAQLRVHVDVRFSRPDRPRYACTSLRLSRYKFYLDYPLYRGYEVHWLIFFSFFSFLSQIISLCSPKTQQSHPGAKLLKKARVILNDTQIARVCSGRLYLINNLFGFFYNKYTFVFFVRDLRTRISRASAFELIHSY